MRDLVIFDNHNELYTKPSDNKIYSLRLPDKIEGIHKVYRMIPSGFSNYKGDSLYSVISNYPMIDYIENFTMIGAGYINGVNEYTISSLQSLQNLKQSFFVEPIFSYNSQTKMIYFNGNDVRYGDTIIFIGSIKEREEYLYDSELFRKMLLAYTLRQWVTNLSLKYNQEDANVIGNGLKLNISAMKEWAERLEDEIDEEIDENQYSMVMGVQRLYG